MMVNFKEWTEAGKDERWILGRKGGRQEVGRTGEEGLERSVSITHAWAVGEWEVVTDQIRLPLSRKRAQRGQA